MHTEQECQFAYMPLLLGVCAQAVVHVRLLRLVLRRVALVALRAVGFGTFEVLSTLARQSPWSASSSIQELHKPV